MRSLFPRLISVLVLSLATSAQPISVAVDLTDAPRNIFHVKLTVPAKPGPMTLVYPKWIPGNHRPSGPIANVTGLKVQAAGELLPWSRDAIDMYAFHLVVPASTKEITITFDTLTSTDSAGAHGAAASSHVLDLNWNQVVLYPQGVASDAVEMAASVQLPVGWKFATALTKRQANATSDVIAFEPVSLTTLVDSPLIAGDHYRQIPLTESAPIHVVDMVAESEAALQMTSADAAAYRKLVAETGVLFGSRHYRNYHFLLTLSDEAGHHGLEHHESSDNSTSERTLIDSDLHLLEAGLLPHEFVHSWNGKYRRPAGLATPNYQEPMVGDLLWVYEGLTEYLGNVLTVRSGLWSEEQYREALADTAAMLDHRAGRKWRPLEDTAKSVQTLRLLGPRWENWRRGLDYYPEGELIWLEVDTIVRQQSQGQKSLDDFCRQFHGGQGGAPALAPYTFNDLVKALNGIVPYDWATLLKSLVQSTSEHAPLAGIDRGGWKLVYTDRPNLFISTGEGVGKYLDAYYSLGFLANADGELEDVIPGSPAYTAGIGPGMKLVAINGRKYSRDSLRDALRATPNLGKLELLVENAHFYKTYTVTYAGGLRMPHLVRSNGDDLLSAILKPRTR